MPLPELPKSERGKVLRDRLREELQSAQARLAAMRARLSRSRPA